VRFVAVFAGCVALLFAGSTTRLFCEHVLPWYLDENAAVAGLLLRMCGLDVVVSGPQISSSSFAIELIRACATIEPSIIFISGVIATPVGFRWKVPGMVLGLFFLTLVNQVRTVTLFLIGTYWNNAFHVMHVDVWQALFILLALLAWILWATWALRRARGAPDRAKR